MASVPENVLARADIAKGPTAAHFSRIPRPPEWSGFVCPLHARMERSGHQGAPSEVWFESQRVPETARGNFSIVISALEATETEQIALKCQVVRL